MSTNKTILEPPTMRYAKPLAFPQFALCEQILNIGLFFDGKDNDHNFHPSKFVARGAPPKPACNSGQARAFCTGAV